MTDADMVSAEEENKCTNKYCSFVSMENSVSFMGMLGAAFHWIMTPKAKRTTASLQKLDVAIGLLARV